MRKGFGLVEFMGKTFYCPNDRSKKYEYNCEYCGKSFHARLCDRNRGWGRFCSKSCAIAYRNQQLKTIWHTNNEEPEQESVCCWYHNGILHAGRFDKYYKCFCSSANYFLDLRKVQKWSYVRDLIKNQKE